MIPIKLERQLRELDTRLNLAPGHGVAESVMEGLVRDVARGDYGLIESGWEFEDVTETRAILEELSRKWGGGKNHRAQK